MMPYCETFMQGGCSRMSSVHKVRSEVRSTQCLRARQQRRTSTAGADAALILASPPRPPLPLLPPLPPLSRLASAYQLAEPAPPGRPPSAGRPPTGARPPAGLPTLEHEVDLVTINDEASEPAQKWVHFRQPATIMQNAC